MSDPKNQSTSVNIQIPTVENLAGRRTLIPVSFGLVVLLFFMSFCDLKCNGTKVASATGFNLVIGTKITPEMPKGMGDFNTNMENGMMGENSGYQSKGSQDEKLPPHVSAILALAAALGGIYVFIRKDKKEELYGTALAAVGFISLLILRSAIKGELEDKGKGMVPIEADFKFAYWAALLAFLVAGALSFLRLRQKQKLEPAPKITGPSNFG